MNIRLFFKRKLLYLITVFCDIFYPKKCVVCGGFINYGAKICLCNKCEGKLSGYGRNVIDDRKHFEEAICAIPYKDDTKSIMTDYKFSNVPLYGKSFAHCIEQKLKGRKFIANIDLICPVPLHPLRDREYNQSNIIARCIADSYGIELKSDLLIKIKNVSKLSKMNYTGRHHSIKNAFTLNSLYNIEGKNIILVDDIYTTGATVEECARILKRYGANSVYVLCACYA